MWQAGEEVWEAWGQCGKPGGTGRLQLGTGEAVLETSLKAPHTSSSVSGVGSQLCRVLQLGMLRSHWLSAEVANAKEEQQSQRGAAAC